MKERLFVPLSKEPYLDFETNGKKVEIRRCDRNFTERTVFPDRRVELSLGYSSNRRMWGNIGEVVVGSLEEIFQQFGLKNVEPRIDNLTDAIAENLDLLGPANQYIGFSINLDQRR
jgi:hypothetical protein